MAKWYLASGPTGELYLLKDDVAVALLLRDNGTNPEAIGRLLLAAIREKEAPNA